MTALDWMLISIAIVTAMILSLIVRSLRGRPLHLAGSRASRATGLPH